MTLFKETTRQNKPDKLIDKHLTLKSDNLYNLRELKEVIQMEKGLNATYSELTNISIIIFTNLIKAMNEDLKENETIANLTEVLFNYRKGNELFENTNLILDISKEG